MTDSVRIQAHARGCTLVVHAKPGARREGAVGARAGAIDVAVHAAPEKGKANKAIVAVLAKALGLKKGQVRLLGGEASRDKRILLQGLTAEEAAERVNKALPPV